VAADEGEAGDGAAAGAEHPRRFGGDVREHTVHVVGDQLGCGVLLGVVDRAAGDAARVGGDNDVVVSEPGTTSAKPVLSMAKAIIMSTGPDPCTS
jgi:hypothetical protein